jgi:hypothetical protein
MEVCIMKIYEVRTTEYNSQQEYSSSHLLAAKDIGHARKLARAYFEKWYEDDQDSHIDPDDLNRFEFLGGSIILKIDSIAETTLEEWKDRQVQLNSINRLPKAKSSCKRCGRLLEACEHIRDCLDVGGEQSRQFADEIAYLKKVIKEASR